jgi:hypothetical protein
MALPKQVAQQLKEIEEIEKQLQAPVSEVPEEPEAVEEDGQTTDESVDEVVAETPKLVEVTPTPPETDKVPEEAWEHKYHRLQGKYDAEVPRLHTQVKELSTLVEQLRKQMEQQPEKPAQTAVERLVTDEDVQEYGAEFVDLQRRIAREEIRADLDAIKAENEKLKQMLLQTGTQMGEVSFEQRLHRLVPDFDQINNDPQWVTWLNTEDPILRAPRRAIAQEAFNKGDADAVAHYVSLFRRESAPAEQEAKPDRRAELERQVQPTRTSAAKAPISKTGKTYSRSDVEKMFTKVALLGSQQKHEEAKKLEAEIDAAFKEGRVAL